MSLPNLQSRQDVRARRAGAAVPLKTRITGLKWFWTDCSGKRLAEIRKPHYCGPANYETLVCLIGTAATTQKKGDGWGHTFHPLVQNEIPRRLGLCHTPDYASKITKRYISAPHKTTGIEKSKGSPAQSRQIIRPSFTRRQGSAVRSPQDPQKTDG